MNVEYYIIYYSFGILPSWHNKTAGKFPAFYSSMYLIYSLLHKRSFHIDECLFYTGENGLMVLSIESSISLDIQDH